MTMDPWTQLHGISANKLKHQFIDLKKKDKLGRTALMVACEHDQKEVFRSILYHSDDAFDSCITDNDKLTTFMYSLLNFTTI